MPKIHENETVADFIRRAKLAPNSEVVVGNYMWKVTDDLGLVGDKSEFYIGPELAKLVFLRGLKTPPREVIVHIWAYKKPGGDVLISSSYYENEAALRRGLTCEPEWVEPVLQSRKTERMET